MKQYIIYYSVALIIASIAQAGWSPSPQQGFTINNLGTSFEARLEYACSHLDQVTDSESQALSDELSKETTYEIRLEEYCDL